MKTLTYQLSFNTPAFLGNAEQQAQWRTPPFKALLRQWWRVVKAPDVGFDHRALLQEENALFGSAIDGAGSSRSKVQMRLSHWQDGLVAKEAVGALDFVDHPEVKPRADPPRRGERVVKAGIYLGYGPLGKNSAVDTRNASNVLNIRVPDQSAAEIAKAIQLAAWFGTVGSRSRNGWGSLQIEGEGVLGLSGLCDSTVATQTSPRSLIAALGDRSAGDWPHAIGLCADERPALWRVVSGRDAKEGKYLGFASWCDVMNRLAELKIGFRTQFKLTTGAPHTNVEKRHVLAYPVTNHGLAGLRDARLANQIRFKVIKDQEGTYFGLISHLPCVMPHAFFDKSSVKPLVNEQQIEVWTQVHHFLNAQPTTSLARIRKG